MITNLILADILDDLRTVAQGGISQAQAYANLRESVPALFPVEPKQADIKAVTDSDEFKEFTGSARRIFAEAFFNAPRMVDGEMVDVSVYGIDTWAADKKAAKEFGVAETKVRKAAQDYVRVAFRQNVTMLIPEAVDAPKAEAEAEKLPDPAAIVALVRGALVILSEKSPDAARTLLNGLDAEVKFSRPFIAEGKVVPPLATK
jgi:hypothetical protein